MIDLPARNPATVLRLRAAVARNRLEHVGGNASERDRVANARPGVNRSLAPEDPANQVAACVLVGLAAA